MVFVLQSGATEYGVIRARTCPLPRGQGQDSREETVPAAKSRQQSAQNILGHHGYVYPLEIKRGLLENPPCMEGISLTS